MFGRFFAFEMGCPEHDSYLYEDEVHEGADLGCECRGLGCSKCKKKKRRVVTLTGSPGTMPVMNMPVAPWTPEMIMMTRQGFY